MAINDDADILGRAQSILGAQPPSDPGASHAAGDDADILGRAQSILGAGPQNKAGMFSSPGRAFETLTAPLGWAKKGVDILGRAGARAQGIDVPDTATTGQMLRQGLGLDASEDVNNTFGRRLAGKASEFIGDLATDPLTYALSGAGKIAEAGKLAGASAEAIRAGEIATKVGRGAAAAFVPGMLAGAAHEGSSAIERYQKKA